MDGPPARPGDRRRPGPQRARDRTVDGRDETLHYDQLIVALGSVSRVLPVPGLAEHGARLQDAADAIALRNRALLQPGDRRVARPTREARGAYLTFVFVGAGYAGLEGIAELQDFVADVIDRYPRCRMEGTRFVLVEARDRIMPEIPPSLAEFATRELRAARHGDPHGHDARRRSTPDSATLVHRRAHPDPHRCAGPPA